MSTAAQIIAVICTAIVAFIAVIGFAPNFKSNE